VALYGSGAELARVAAAFDKTYEAAMKEPARLAQGPSVVDELRVRRDRRRTR
jgi:hypothetical protein